MKPATAPQRWRRSLVGAVVASCAFGATLVPGGGVLAEDAPSTLTNPLGGFRHLGRLSDPGPYGDVSLGSLLLDPVHRLAFLYNTDVDGTSLIRWRVFDLDSIENGELEQVGTLESQACVGETTCSHASNTDGAGTAERVFAIDPAGGRIFASAKGSLYEIAYEPNFVAEPDQEVAAVRWVAPPNPGGVPRIDSFLREFGPTRGIHYDPGPADGSAPRIYLVGELQASTASAGIWLAAWDARPSSATAIPPEARQLWAYVPRNCASLARASGAQSKLHQAVFEKDEWLYTFCEAHDRTARGVLRVHLSGSGVSLRPGEPAPDGVEEFFPGVTGQEFESFADPAAERLYLMSKNVLAGGRSLLVFDGTISQGQGGYIGAIGLVDADNPQRATAGLDPVTGRWYFQDQNELWTFEGRQRRVFPPSNYPNDLDGDPTGFATARRIYVDPAQLDPVGRLLRPARIFVQRESTNPTKRWYEIYEDTRDLPTEGVAPTENTIDEPEGPESVGVYTGVTSAYGLQVLDLRGLSAAVPAVGGVTEGPTTNNPPNPGVPTDYLRDPFFYSGGDCGKTERQIALARVLKTRLSGDLFSQSAEGEALAVDPDRHRKSAPDATDTRRDVDDPDHCLTELWRYVTGGLCDPFIDNNPDGEVNDDDGTLCGGGKWFGHEAPFGNFCEPVEDANGDGQIDDRDSVCGSPSAIWDRLRQEFCGPDGSQCGGFCDPDASGSSRCDWPTDDVGPSWWYAKANCRDDTAGATAVAPPQAPLPGASESVCQATAEQPSTLAGSRVLLSPEQSAAVVTVTGAETSTDIDRLPGQGLVATSRARVFGISVAGLVTLDELRVEATVHATGRSKEKGGGSGGTFVREFLGLRVAGQLVCAVCGQEEVVEQINRALGPIGYVRVADPEADIVLGTTKGTSAAIQKDFQQQDADGTMNRDDSTEWPGLEIGLYRDSDQRGPGRLVYQLGGVFTQVQFGVVPKPPDFGFADFDDEPVAEATNEDDTIVAGSDFVAAEPPRTYTVTIGGEEPAGSVAAAPGGGLLEQVADGLRKSIKMALLLAALWGLIYAPVYLVRRRQLLREVMRL